MLTQSSTDMLEFRLNSFENNKIVSIFRRFSMVYEINAATEC
jgi:hypothetical protein